MKFAVEVIVFVSLITLSRVEALCVNGLKANMRSRPHTKGEVYWVAEKFTPVRKLYRKGKWIKVKDPYGYKNWIAKSLVTDNFRCAAVNVDRIDLHEGPGGKYKKHEHRPHAYFGNGFKVIQFKKKWAKLKDEDGLEFWALRDQLWIQ